MREYYSREETRAMLSPRARELFDAGINNWLEPKPATPNPRQALAEECRQLKDAISVCERLGMSALPLYIRLHEIEDGY
jgi:hypothetical protein